MAKLVKAKKKRPDAERNKPPAVALTQPAAAGNIFALSNLVVTLAVGIVAFSLAAPQLLGEAKPGTEITLAALNQRAEALQKVTDPIQRDSYCIPLSAYGRALDRALDKNARIFVTGILGKTNVSKGGYYYFLQNHLFPRAMEISLDGHAVADGSFFVGVPCDSPDVLKAKGFDLMIRLESNGPQLIPLTPKGTPHE